MSDTSLANGAPMSESGTVIFERSAPRIATVTFANPPANVTVGETLARLASIVRDLEHDPEVQVVAFRSAVPDFFLNHFLLAAVDSLPMPRSPDALPVWTDTVLRLSKAPYISIASIRGHTRGAGNELALARDLRYASREKASFGQPEVGAGQLPGGGGTERLPRAIGRDRALEAILTSAD